MILALRAEAVRTHVGGRLLTESTGKSPERPASVAIFESVMGLEAGFERVAGRSLRPSILPYSASPRQITRSDISFATRRTHG